MGISLGFTAPNFSLTGLIPSDIDLQDGSRLDGVSTGQAERGVGDHRHAARRSTSAVTDTIGPTSPFIDSLAAEGTVFLSSSSSAAAWTKPSTGTILTGLYPSRHGALYHGSSLQLPEGHFTLAETFRNAGYVDGRAS